MCTYNPLIARGREFDAVSRCARTLANFLSKGNFIAGRVVKCRRLKLEPVVVGCGEAARRADDGRLSAIKKDADKWRDAPWILTTVHAAHTFYKLSYGWLAMLRLSLISQDAADATG